MGWLIFLLVAVAVVAAVFWAKKHFRNEIERAKPAAAKGRYHKRVATSSTMGPGVKISPEARVEH